MSNRLKRKHREEMAVLQSFRDKLAYKYWKEIEKKLNGGEEWQ